MTLAGQNKKYEHLCKGAEGKPCPSRQMLKDKEKRCPSCRLKNMRELVAKNPKDRTMREYRKELEALEMLKEIDAPMRLDRVIQKAINCAF